MWLFDPVNFHSTKSKDRVKLVKSGVTLLKPCTCLFYETTQFCRIKGCGGAGCPPPPPIIVERFTLPQQIIYTILQNKRMRRCGVPPPPIIFERLKLPQQIIYRRKENLSESPNHQKYWENVLVSRFYEQFSRNRRNLGHFRKFEKISIHIHIGQKNVHKSLICFKVNSKFNVERIMSGTFISISLYQDCSKYELNNCFL